MKTEHSEVSEKANASNGGRYAETKTLPFGIAELGSFKRQIILVFVVGFFSLTIAFTAYQVRTESIYLYHDNTNGTINLAESLATSSRSWALARDVAGLQEIVLSFQSHPELRYAMVISPSGRVLAHTDTTKVGQFVSDEASLALIKSPPVNRVMIDNESVSDIAVPIMVDHRHVGWARVAQGREGIVSNLRKMMLSSALYVLMAVVLSLLAALLIANRLGYRIGYLVRVAEEVQAGNYAMRADISGEDEIARLAKRFNHMLDVLAQDEEQLRAASLYTRSLIEASLDPLVTISPEGKITNVNKAGEVVTGRNRSELVGTDFSDYFTEPDKARAGYQQVFLQGTVTDYPLVIRHRDGRVTEVLYNASVYRNEAGEVLGVFAAARDVTERNKAETALRKNEELLQTTIKFLPVGLWVFDAEGKIIFSNEAAKQIWAGAHHIGIDQLGEYKGWRLDNGKMVKPHEWAGARALEKGEISIEEEIEIECFDGTRKIILDSAVPLRKSDGSIWGAVTINHDITGRKLAEDTLREKEERLALATVNNGVGVWDWNLQTQKMIWDDSMFALYHIRREDFSGTEEAWRASLHPDDLTRGDQEVADAISGKKPFETEFRVVWPNGEIRYIKAVAKVFRDNQGNPLRMLGINMDVTDRNKAEMALRESEDKFKYVFDHSPIGKTLTLPSGELQVNQSFCEMLGYTDQELAHSRWQNITHPDDIELTQRSIDKLLSDEQDSTRFVKRYLHKNGSEVWVDVVTFLRRDPKGKPLYFITSVIDISERKRAEEELRKYHEQLEELVRERTSKLEAANKELEAFSYSVSHDLRSPLRAIDGFSHILQDDYADKLDDEGKRLLNVVRDNAQRMGQLIDDILKFSRTSRLEMIFSEIDMEGLAHSVIEELQPAGAKLQVEIATIPPATGDPAMMHQVFVNLLSNAIKFSRSREIATIKVGGSIEGEEAVYYVKDNGAGFDMQYADKLFGVFQRLHGMNEFEGTGIGLAIVKRIINRHGGRVWAEGKVNEGATVYFSIPAPTLKRS